MSEEYGFKGVWVTATLWLNKELNWTEKALIAEIDCLCRHDNPCFASIETLAKRINTATSRTAQLLSELTRKGHLLQLGSDGRHVWRCTAPQYWQDPGMIDAWESRFAEKAKGDLSNSITQTSRIQHTELLEELPNEKPPIVPQGGTNEVSKNGKAKKEKLTAEFVLHRVRPDLALQSPSFVEAWALWVKNRLELPKPTIGAFAEHMRICGRLGESKAVVAIHYSIANNWASIFEPRPESPLTQKARRESAL